MRRLPGALAAVLLAAPLGAAAAHASDWAYQYRIEHPRYGDIGTYTNVVRQSNGTTEVDTELHAAVRILGIVVFREDATRTERWQRDRLIAFQSVTVTNGNRMEVHGEAKDGHFVVTGPLGTVTAPANVHPSNPWAAMVLDTDTMMSTKSGKVQRVRVRDSGEEPVTLDGATMRLHQYEIDSDKRQFVWLDDKGLPVAFQTVEDGAPIDFVLQRRELTDRR